MTEAQFRQKVLDILDEVGAHIKSADDIDIISSLSEWERLASSITLPGVEMEQANVKRYVAVPLSYFARYVEEDSSEIRDAWVVWFGANDSSGVQKQWKDLKAEAIAATNAANDAADSVDTATENANNAAEEARRKGNTAQQQGNTAQQQGNTAEQQGDEAERQGDEAERQGNVAEGQGNTAQQKGNTAEAKGNTAEGQGNYAKDQGDYAKDQGDYAKEQGNDAKDAAAEWNDAGGYKDQIETAIDNAEDATEEAENVDADLTGMTVTITNRRGTSKSVNIGFEITPDHVYPSFEAMKADAANVLPGKFCMIATTDPTAEDNARLYSRNSSAATSSKPFTFLSDLDQASTAAFADWLNNYKPQIEAAIAYANGQGDYAKEQGQNANSIWNTVKNWFNGTNNDGFKATSESWIANTQSAWNNWFSDSLATGVRKLWNDFWSNINTRWTNFFGEETGTPTKGVQKTWADWFTGRQSDWNSYKDAKDIDWNVYKGTKDTDWGAYKDDKDDDWDDYKDAKDTDWGSYKSSKDTNWDAYKGAKDSDWASYKSGKDTDWASWVAARLSEWTAWVAARLSDWNSWWDARKLEWSTWFTNGVVTTWNAWFSDTDSNGVRKLWNGFWTNINTLWTDFYGEASGTPTKGVRKIWTDWFGADDTSGVQKQWKDTKADAVAATGHANTQGDYAKTQGDYAKDQGDHAKTEGDRCEAYNDHPQEIRSDGYIWAWDETTGQMQNTGRRVVATLDISSLTPQQKQELIEQFALNPATNTEAEGIADGTKTTLTNEEETKVWREGTMLAYHNKLLLTVFTPLAARVSTLESSTSDIADIRRGAAKGDTAYQLPETGIPASDLATAVQNLLTAAGTALQPSDLTTLNGKVAALESLLSDGENVTAAIDKFYEIVAFLANITNTETLEGIISGINNAIATKQDRLTFASAETCAALLNELT